MRSKKFSYSKLNTYESCGWRYFLTYEDGHYISGESIATAIGTLVHWIEESIARTIQKGEQPDYEKLKDDFKNIRIEKGTSPDQRSGLYGVNFIKEKYPEEFYQPDENGSSYYTRCLDYLTHGIYRLENYLKANPNLEIYGMEKFFSIGFEGNVLSGYIDRIFYDKEEDIYYIEDIKTKNKPFKDSELITPLQFVIYVHALAENLGLSYDHFRCSYDLPFLDKKQEAGTRGFVKRGLKKIQDIFAGIESKEFEPSPSPLCRWCSFSPTNPDQPEAGKLLCPYYSLWTRENKTSAVAHKWEGKENHDRIMSLEIEQQANKPPKQEQEFDFDF